MRNVLGLLAPVLVASALCGPACSLAQSAPGANASCHIDNAGMSAGEQALQLEDWNKAASIFRKVATEDPSSLVAQAGLVRVSLGRGEIADALKKATDLAAGHPDSDVIQSVLAETYLRRGEIPQAQQTLSATASKFPCNARAYFLLGRLRDLLGYHASAAMLFRTAHQLAPNDEQLTVAWMFSLPPEERFAKLKPFLETAQYLNQDDREDLKSNVLMGEAKLHSTCTVSSPKTGTRTTIFRNVAEARQPYVPTIDVVANGTKMRAFYRSSGADISLPYNLGVSLGLVPLVKVSYAILYRGSRRNYYFAKLDSLKIGEVEYKNCLVRVLNEPEQAEAETRSQLHNKTGAEISIGGMFLSDFAVTTASAAGELRLAPLPPPSPAKDNAGLPLWSDVSQSDGQPVPSINGGAWGHYDRSTPPEMKGGSALVETYDRTWIPTIIGAGSPLLFELEYDSPWPRISTGAAAAAQKIETVATGANKPPFKGYFEEFGGIYFPVDSWTAVRWDEYSKHLKLETSGTIGQQALLQTNFTIDYRDNLVRFESTAPTKR